jgi:hypothetical protein
MLTPTWEQGVALVDTADEPAPGWALVRMLAASMNRVSTCAVRRRDLRTLPLIMGVDGVGEVVAAPQLPGFGSPVIRPEFCGECAGCLSGKPVQTVPDTLRIPEHPPRHFRRIRLPCPPARSSPCPTAWQWRSPPLSASPL